MTHKEPQSPVDTPDIGGHGLGLMEAFTPELREKMVRLEKENQIMRKRLETEAEAVAPVPGAPKDEGLRRKVSIVVWSYSQESLIYWYHTLVL